MDKERRKASELLFHLLLLCWGLDVVRSNAVFQCPAPKGMYPDPTSSNRFYECRDGQATLHTCGSGTVFKDGVCVVDPSENSQEKTEEASNESPEGKTDNKTETTTVDVASTSASTTTTAVHGGNMTTESHTKNQGSTESAETTISISSTTSATISASTVNFNDSKSENDMKNASAIASAPSTRVRNGTVTGLEKFTSQSNQTTTMSSSALVSKENTYPVTTSIHSTTPTITTETASTTTFHAASTDITEKTFTVSPSTSKPIKQNSNNTSTTTSKSPKTQANKGSSKKNATASLEKSTRLPIKKTTKNIIATTASPTTTMSQTTAGKFVPKLDTYQALVDALSPQPHEPFRAPIDGKFQSDRAPEPQVFQAWWDDTNTEEDDRHRQEQHDHGQHSDHDHTNNQDFNPLHPKMQPGEVFNHRRDNFKCPDVVGFFRHPTDCSRFYRCVDNKPTPMFCTPGTAFDPEAHVCSWIVGEDGCGGMLKAASFRRKRHVGEDFLKIGRDEVRTGREGVKIKTDDEDVTEDDMSEMEEINDKDRTDRDRADRDRADRDLTDRDLTDRDLTDKDGAADDKETDNPQDDVPPSEPYNHRDEYFRCPEVSGYFRHPTNCSRFYWCIDNKPTAMFCSAGTAFDPETFVCSWIVGEDGCGGRLPPAMHLRRRRQARKDARDDLTRDDNTDDVPSSGTHNHRHGWDDEYFRCPEVSGFFRHPTNCSRFYWCIDNKPTAMFCSEGTAFDPETHVCSWIVGEDGCGGMLPPASHGKRRRRQADYDGTEGGEGDDAAYEGETGDDNQYDDKEENDYNDVTEWSDKSPDVTGSDHSQDTTRTTDLGKDGTDNSETHDVTKKAGEKQQKAGETEKKGETEKNGETEKKGETEKTGETEKDGEAEKDGETDETTPIPEEVRKHKENVVNGIAHGMLIKRERRDATFLDSIISTINSLLTPQNTKRSRRHPRQVIDDFFGEEMVSNFAPESNDNRERNFGFEASSTDFMASKVRFQCPGDGFYADPEDCTIFYHCSNGKAYQHRCQPGTAFNKDKFVCSWPVAENGCGGMLSVPFRENLEEQLGITTRPASTTFQCPEVDGYYPDPHDCKVFYHCAMGNPYQHTCGGGTAFNVDQGVCAWPLTENGCGSVLNAPFKAAEGNLEDERNATARNASPMPLEKASPIPLEKADPIFAAETASPIPNTHSETSTEKPDMSVSNVGPSEDAEKTDRNANSQAGSEKSASKVADNQNSDQANTDNKPKREVRIANLASTSAPSTTSAPMETTSEAVDTRAAKGKSYRQTTSSWPWDKVKKKRKSMPPRGVFPTTLSSDTTQPTIITSKIAFTRAKIASTTPKTATFRASTSAESVSTSSSTTTSVSSSSTTTLPPPTSETMEISTTNTTEETTPPVNDVIAEAYRVTGTGAEFRCPSDSGHFRDPLNCAIYYHCAGGVAYRLDCPTDTLYDTQKHKCLPVEEVKDCHLVDQKLLEWEEQWLRSYADGKMSFQDRNGYPERPRPGQNERFQFECPEQYGYFRNPVDCASYVECMDGVPYPRKCMSGTMFDPMRKKCTWGSLVPDCHVAVGSHPPTETIEPADFQCPTSEGYYRDPFSCSAYYHCIDGRPMPRVCDPNFFFDPRASKCRWAKLVQDCDQNGFPIFIDKLPLSSFVCPLPNGHFRDPTDCSVFYHCLRDYPYKGSCRPKHAFDVATMTCLPRDQVEGCGLSVSIPQFDQPTKGTEETLKTEEAEVKDNNGTDSIVPGDTFRCPKAHGIYRDPHDCRVFYHCFSGRNFRHECQDGTVFSTEKNLCTWPHLVPECLVTSQQQPDVKPFKLPLDLPDQAPLGLQNPLPLDLQNQMPLGLQNPLPLDLPNHMPLGLPNQLPVDLQNQLPLNLQNQLPLDFQDLFPLGSQDHMPLGLPDQLHLGLQNQLPLDWQNQPTNEESINAGTQSPQDQGTPQPPRNSPIPFYAKDQLSLQAIFQDGHQEPNGAELNAPTQFDSFEFDLADPQRHVPEISSDGLNDFRLEAPLPEAMRNPMVSQGTHSNFVCPAFIFDQYYRDPQDCTVFHRCVRGVRYTFNCPRGTFFDPTYYICDFMENVHDCDHEGRRTGSAREPLGEYVPPGQYPLFETDGESMSEASPESLSEVRCPQRDGLYPHPSSCQKFLFCSKGIPTVLTCPGDLMYNMNTMTCDYDENIICVRYDK